MKKENLPTMVAMLHNRQLFPGEYEICRRYGVHLSVNVDGYTERDRPGVLHLTTIAMLFRSFAGDECVFAIDLPLLLTEEEEFEQPLLGANRLTGATSPLSGSGIANKLRWEMSFHEGVGDWVSRFMCTITELRKTQESVSDAPKQGSDAYAFVVPGDEMTLYVLDVRGSHSFLN